MLVHSLILDIGINTLERDTVSAWGVAVSQEGWL